MAKEKGLTKWDYTTIIITSYCNGWKEYDRKRLMRKTKEELKEMAQETIRAEFATENSLW